MERIQKAAEIFEEGFACSQSVFSVFAPELGMDEKTALKLSTGFGGGMGRMGNVCGAVTGAFMAIGLKYGRTEVDDDAAKAKTNELIREFTERFTSIHDSIICNDLIEGDISTEEGAAEASELGVFDTVCPNYVRDAVRILEEIL